MPVDYHFAWYKKDHGWQVLKHFGATGQEVVIYEYLSNTHNADLIAHRMNQNPVWK
jgi:hypothetical protein